MEIGAGVDKSSSTNIEGDIDLRKGPWTLDEDLMLITYIADHGEGRWNSLARAAGIYIPYSLTIPGRSVLLLVQNDRARRRRRVVGSRRLYLAKHLRLCLSSSGLKRTGKSCRLRWLNYLRPDVKRGEFAPEEQLLILELHSRWGNRWSKIAQGMPGRTDNEIKNYWRTRVQKHAKQLKCDVNSQQFKDVIKCLWVPRLLERIQAANQGSMALTGGELGQVGPSTGSSCGPQPSILTTQLPTSPAVTVTTNSNCVEGCENKGGDGTREAEFNGFWCESWDDPCGYSHQGSLDLEWWQSENLWSIEDHWII